MGITYYIYYNETVKRTNNKCTQCELKLKKYLQCKLRATFRQKKDPKKPKYCLPICV